MGSFQIIWKRLKTREYYVREKHTFMCAIFSSFLGISLTLAGESWWLSGAPKPITIQSISIRTVPDVPKEYWLDVQLIAPTSRNCVRQTQNLLYRKIDGTTVFVPLGSAINGLNYSNPPNEFEISLKLPLAISAGEWNYIDRSLYSCVLWPGLLRQHEYETPPQKIDIPP